MFGLRSVRLVRTAAVIHQYRWITGSSSSSTTMMTTSLFSQSIGAFDGFRTDGRIIGQVSRTSGSSSVRLPSPPSIESHVSFPIIVDNFSKLLSLDGTGADSSVFHQMNGAVVKKRRRKMNKHKYKKRKKRDRFKTKSDMGGRYA